MDETKNKYKEFTDDMHILYESFCESGFTEDQAILLTNNYVSVLLGLHTFNQRPHKRGMTEAEKQTIREAINKKRAENEKWGKFE